MPRQLKADKKMFFSSSAGYRGTHIISFQPSILQHCEHPGRILVSHSRSMCIVAPVTLLDQQSSKHSEPDAILNPLFQPPKCEINEDCKQLLHHSYQHDWFAGKTTTEATSNDIRRRLDAEGETWCLICTGWLPDLRH